MKLKFLIMIPLLFLLFLSISMSSYGNNLKFRDVTERYQVAGYWFYGGHGVFWFDADGDGDLDIYVQNVGGKIPNIPNLLFINYGSGVFVEEALQRGLADALPVGTHGAAPLDWDKDGDIDVISTTTPGASNFGYIKIYLNDGNGYFSDVTEVMLTQKTSYAARGIGPGYFEKDKENIGVVLTNAVPYPYPWAQEIIGPLKVKNFLDYDGTKFTLKFRGDEFTGFQQGILVFDCNGDGHDDYIKAKWFMPSELYINNGDGTFYEAGAEWGLSQVFGERDNAFVSEDINNDGLPDLLVEGSDAQGNKRIVVYLHMGDHFEENQILYGEFRGGFHPVLYDFDDDGVIELIWPGEGYYENDGKGWFTLVEDVEGLEVLRKLKDIRGCSVGWLDGKLHIYVTNKKGYNVMLRRESNSTNWIQVEIVEDHVGAWGGIGTKVYLYIDGVFVAYRQLILAQGYLGLNQLLAHFGLPYRGSEYMLMIVFPNGAIKYIKAEPGQRVRVYYGFTLKIEASEGGTTDPAPGIYVHDKGEEVDVTALSHTHYAFGGWTGDVTSNENPVTIIMNNSKKIKPNFKLIEPPDNFTAVRVVNKTLLYREKMNKLTWEPNPHNEGFNIIGYRILQLQDDKLFPERNPLYLAEVDADTSEYHHRHVDPTKDYVYQIIALTDEGGEGIPAYARVDAQQEETKEATEKKQGKKSSQVRR
ncbi:VCBS repeat-containing protein [Candidatus Woesearchaeota archaeon]|nr:VCBS repeat-containing protein [Candidatus Woesearchaeota archaeon]